jgi:Ricin-type beta-trefoil lectin domain
VRMWECANHPNQLWEVQHEQRGEIQGARLKNRASDFCLDTDGRGENGGVVRMWTCANHPNQLWEIGARLKNRASGFCLDTDGRAVNGGAVRMWECAVHNNQGWRRRKLAQP